MQSKLTARVLAHILQARGWNQLQLAERTGIIYSTVSNHLLRGRPIRDNHIIAYLKALDNHTDRQILLSAWLRDTLSNEVIADVLNVTENRVREEVAEWAPELDQEQSNMLRWWSDRLTHDPELDEIFRMVTRKAGYKPSA